GEDQDYEPEGTPRRAPPLQPGGRRSVIAPVRLSTQSPGDDSASPSISPGLRLRAAHVVARARIDLDQFAFLNEERDVHRLAGLENRGLRHIRRGIAAETFRRFHHLELDRRWQLD